MDAVRNPFSPGAGNPPPELAGRHSIIDDIEVALQRVALGRPVQFPILVGLRGVGKTVLLVKAKAMAEALGFVVIDVEAHDSKTLPQLIVPGIRRALLQLSLIERAKDMTSRGLRVMKGFLGALSIKVGELELSISTESEPGTADTGDLEADLPELFEVVGEAARASSRPIAFIIDELQYLSDAEFSALIMAMHRINQRGLPVMLIGAGLPQILGLAGNSKSYSERLFRYPQVGPLTEEEGHAALAHPVESEAAQIDEAAIARILLVTERYPYFLQQWGYEAWNVAEGPRITLVDVQRADDLALAALDQSFFKVRLDRCTPSEKNYMRALAELGTGHHRSADVAERLGVKITSVAPVRNNLIKKGMVYSPAYGDTAFTVPMFDDYMRRAIPDFGVRSA